MNLVSELKGQVIVFVTLSVDSVFGTNHSYIYACLLKSVIGVKQKKSGNVRMISAMQIASRQSFKKVTCPFNNEFAFL